MKESGQKNKKTRWWNKKTKTWIVKSNHSIKSKCLKCVDKNIFSNYRKWKVRDQQQNQ